MNDLMQDLRFLLRSTTKKPLYFFVSILLISIGIGATSAVFGIVDAVIFRPLPYRDPSRLIVLGTTFPEFYINYVGNPDLTTHTLTGVSPPNFVDWKTRNTSFESMAAVSKSTLVLTGGNEPERVASTAVTESFFPILAVSPTVGRGFTQEDFSSQSSSVALVSFGLWQRRFGGDFGILDSSMRTVDRSLTIVGILPRDFRPPEALYLKDVDIWTPLVFGSDDLSSRTRRSLRVIGKLRSDVSLETAREEMRVLGDALATEYPEALDLRTTPFAKDNPEVKGVFGIGVDSLQRQTVGDHGSALLLFLGAVSLLLVIACLNLAHLALARGLERSRELALRTALGAGRLRILQQLLTESIIISFVGAALGILLAFLSVELFHRLYPGDLPRLGEVGLDLRVLGFAFSLSVFTGLIFGLIPAFQHDRHDVNLALKEGSGAVTSGKSRIRRRGALVVAETALALVLLIGAGLLFRSFVGLMKVAPGFRTEDSFSMSIRLGSDYETDLQKSDFFHDVLHDIERIPGVKSTAAIVDLPLGDVSWRPTVTTSLSNGAMGVNGHIVSRDYFKTLGIEILQGRDFKLEDRQERLPVVIINRSLAERLWPTGDALDQRIRISLDEAAPWVTVVGVVSDIRQRGLHLPPEPELFVPFSQQPWSRMNVVVHHEIDLSSVVGPIRQAIWNVDPSLPIERLQTLDSHVRSSVRESRFFTVLLTCFAVVALVLACAGILGTMFYTVEQRTAEMGIRMALGASPRDVLGMVLGQGMLHVGVGIALGLLGAYATSEFLSGWIYGISPHDPFTFMVISVALALTALIACWIPARRAQKISPATCLRWE